MNRQAKQATSRADAQARLADKQARDRRMAHFYATQSDRLRARVETDIKRRMQAVEDQGRP